MQISNGKVQMNPKFNNLIIQKLKHSFAYLHICIFAYFVAYLLICLFAYFTVRPAFAAGNNLISVTPQIVHLDLISDPPEAEYLYVNNTSYPVELSFSMQDIKELSESGIPGFVDQKDAANYKYGLSSWVTFDKQDLILNPGEKGTIKVLIDKAKLTQGGHYASILAEVKQKDEGKAVKIKAVLASLLFVRASTGYEREEAKISYFGVLQDFWQFPEKFLMRFQNTGNVDLIPYGTLEINDMYGKQASRGIVNEGSLITLPESIRRYDIPVHKLVDFLPLGFYKATLSVHFGNSNQTAISTTSFFSEGDVDLRLAGGGFAALVILIFVLKRKFKRKTTTKE